MVEPGAKLVRHRLVWIVDEVSRTPDFSLRARVFGEQTGPWRALLRREDNTLPYRKWVEVDSLAAKGFRTHTEARR